MYTFCRGEVPTFATSTVKLHHFSKQSEKVIIEMRHSKCQLRGVELFSCENVAFKNEIYGDIFNVCRVSILGTITARGIEEDWARK